MLHSIKDKYQNVSYADLIVLAGLTSLESMNKNHNLTFCGGAVDASDANGSDILAPRVYSSPNITVSDDFQVKGLSPDEGVALASRLNVSSQYYVDLIAAGGGNGGNFTDEELALLEGDFRAIVDSFAANETLLFKTFDRAWTYLLTADRYSNNRENACTGVATVTTAAEASSTSAGATFAPSLLYILCAAGIALFL